MYIQRTDLCYRSVVCLSCPVCLSATLVYYGQTAKSIKIKLGIEVGLGPGHIVLDGDPAPPPQRGTAPQFSAHVCCGQTFGWIKMPLGTKIGVGPGDIMLDVDPAPPKKGHSRNFRQMSAVIKPLVGPRCHLLRR